MIAAFEFCTKASKFRRRVFWWTFSAESPLQSLLAYAGWRRNAFKTERTADGIIEKYSVGVTCNMRRGRMNESFIFINLEGIARKFGDEAEGEEEMLQKVCGVICHEYVHAAVNESVKGKFKGEEKVVDALEKGCEVEPVEMEEGRRETFSSDGLFGVKRARAEELAKEMLDAARRLKTMEELAEAMDLQNSGEVAYKAFLYGTFVEKNQMSAKMGDMMKEMQRRFG